MIHKKHPSLLGSTVGRWSVIGIERQASGKSKYVCRCECGNEKTVWPQNIRKGSNSCGCLMKELSRQRATTHGKSGLSEYNVWHAMTQRCSLIGDKRYADYGGRGINVCSRWLGQEGVTNFLSDMGPRPSPKHSLDRINVDGNYEPSNCRWATAKEQRANQRAKRLDQFSDAVLTQEILRRTPEYGLSGC